MNTNTNGFNFYSDYQGHGGVHIIIIVILFFGLILLGASFKNDKPTDNSYNNVDDSVNIDNNSDLNNDYDNTNNSNDNTSNQNDNDVNDNSKGNMFEYYQG